MSNVKRVSTRNECVVLPAQAFIAYMRERRCVEGGSLVWGFEASQNLAWAMTLHQVRVGDTWMYKSACDYWLAVESGAPVSDISMALYHLQGMAAQHWLHHKAEDRGVEFKVGVPLELSVEPAGMLSGPDPRVLEDAALARLSQILLVDSQAGKKGNRLKPVSGEVEL